MCVTCVVAAVSCSQNLYNCGPNKVPLPGELQAVEVVQRIKVSAPAWLVMFIPIFSLKCKYFANVTLCSLLTQQPHSVRFSLAMHW